jgi:hypothetical protein
MRWEVRLVSGSPVSVATSFRGSTILEKTRYDHGLREGKCKRVPEGGSALLLVPLQIFGTRRKVESSSEHDQNEDQVSHISSRRSHTRSTDALIYPIIVTKVMSHESRFCP